MLFFRRNQTHVTLAILFLITIGVYWGVWYGYFQQDEWNGFSRIIISQKDGILSLIRFSGFHFTPLSIFFVSFLYALFGLNHVPYGIYSISMHALNVCSVFLLSQLMTKNRTIALLSALVFLVSYTPYQTVTWYAASMSFLPSTLLALVGLILFELYLQKNKTIFLVMSLIIIFLSAGFRENTIVLLLYFFIRSRQARISVVITGLLYLCIRFVPLLFTSKLTTVAPHVSTFIPTEILYQAITFIILYLPRILIPTQIPLAIGQLLLGTEYRLAYNSILNIFYIGVWVFIIFFFKNLKKTQLIGNTIIFVFLSLLPLALIPRPNIMEPRHFYLTSVGYSILMGALFYQYIHKKIAVVLFCLLLIGNVYFIRQEIAGVIKTSNTRIHIIKNWLSLYPTIPSKTLFLTVGDPLGFQTGFGQMLMVMYRISPLLKDNFLAGMNEQGYKEEYDRGFGYFTSDELLLTAYCSHAVHPTNVFVVSYDKRNTILTDVSSIYRKALICPIL